MRRIHPVSSLCVTLPPASHLSGTLCVFDSIGKNEEQPMQALFSAILAITAKTKTSRNVPLLQFEDHYSSVKQKMEYAIISESVLQINSCICEHQTK